MKIRLFILALLYFWGGLTWAQDTILGRSSRNSEARIRLLKEQAYDIKNNAPLKAMRLASESLFLAGKLGKPKGEAEAYHTIGLIYMQLGRYQEGLANLQEALEIRKEINDKVGLARSYNNIGQISFIQGNLDEALNYFLLSLDFRQQERDSIGILYSYISIGEVFQRKGDFEQAFDYYNKASEFGRAIRNTKGIALTHLKRGSLYEDINSPLRALNQYGLAMEIYQDIDDKNLLGQTYNKIGSVLISQASYDSAVVVLTKALDNGKQSSSAESVRDSYELIARAYFGSNNYAEAYNFQTRYTNLKDSLQNRNKTDAIASIQAEYELEKKENEVRELEGQEKINQLRNIFSIGLAIGALLLGILSVIFTRYRIQTKTTRILSEQKSEIESKNKELEMSNLELEDFAQAVSHDLKQPLRTIGSYTGVIKHKYGKVLGDEAREYMSFVTNGVHQMHHLLSDLLIYSKIGHDEGPKESINLNELLEEVTSNLEGQIAAKGAMVKIGSMPTVLGYYSGLIQVFQNLVSNGLKFHSDQPPFIQISHKRVGSDHQFLVQDNGIGIKPEYQEQIFNAFQRLHTQEEYPGTGIGLAICQKVIKHHGGRIWVESQEGEGSSFYFTLPISS
jgi:signal transduction histidine kinase